MKTSLCSISFPVAAFVSDWNHVDQIADYLASTTSIDKLESFRYGNLLSTLINEILETIHLSDRPDSTAEIEISTEGQRVEIDMHLDSNDGVVAFYQKIIQQISRGSGEKLYREYLFSKSHHHELGILGIYTHYQTDIRCRDAAPNRTTIEVSVELDRFLVVAP